MTITWTPDLATGNMTIDSEHKELIRMIGNLMDLNNHLRYHAEFRKTVQDIATKIEKEGASVALLAQINQNIGVWFTNHIRMQDKRVAEHLKNTGIV